MGKKKTAPSSKIKRKSKKHKNSLSSSGRKGGSGNFSLSEKGKNKKNAQKRKLQNEVENEHADFREEQWNLQQRNKATRTGIAKEKNKSGASFQPAKALFQPSNDIVLSQGLSTKVGGLGQSQASGMSCDRMEENMIDYSSNINPLQSLASQYRQQERREREDEIEASKISSENRFQALLDDSDDDEVKVRKVTEEQKAKPFFNFAPAAFTHQANTSVAYNESALITAEVDPDL